MIKIVLSIKQKSILFVLLLISILLLTLYFQNRVSNKNNFVQIETNYKNNFDNFYKLFEQNLIKYYEAQSKIIKNDKTYLQELKTDEPFLKKINIVEFEKNKISTPYTNEIKKNKAFIDIQLIQGIVDYKIIVPIENKNSIDSYIEYILDSRILLQTLKNFDGSDGILLTGDNNISNNIFLDAYKNSDYFKQLALKCEETKDEPIVEFLSSFYVKKEFLLKNFKGENVANAMFFLNITKDKKAFLSFVKDSFFTSVLLFIIAAIAVNYFFNYLIKKIEKNEEKLKEINKDLENRIEKEIQQRVEIEKQALSEKRKSDQLLIQQSKLAMLGEMIGNIAHQWRQPLMEVSSIFMFIDAYNEKKKLTPELLQEKLEEGDSLIEYMSKTIEDFRNYYKPEKQKEEFFIKDSICSALFILDSSLKNSNIKVESLFEDESLKIKSFKNEFSQALLNIITNAKDILIQRTIENPTIYIKVQKENETISITLEDNAGGIDENILPKIFDPYFTTKHKSQGTGIGLYMTKMIIENNMNGKIEVCNTKLGAKFNIMLPLS